jgi:hypothetical protein
MSKWVTFGLVAAASLGLAGVSSADVPSSLTSTVLCECHATAGGGASGALPLKCTITPSGTNPSEDVHVHVTVRNVVGAPLAGSTTTATSVGLAGAIFVWDNGVSPPEADEDPQTGLSDAGGNVNFTFDEGGVNNAPVAASPNLDFAVTASGPGPGGPVTLAGCSPQLTVVSYDLNANGQVNSIDVGIFASDIGFANTRSDFNFSGGAVNSVDVGLFAAEIGADLAAQ